MDYLSQALPCKHQILHNCKDFLIEKNVKILLIFTIPPLAVLTMQTFDLNSLSSSNEIIFSVDAVKGR